MGVLKTTWHLLQELDASGHALGGPLRFAVYAPHEVATCINDCADATCQVCPTPL
jgi:hypothetical protein